LRIHRDLWKRAVALCWNRRHAVLGVTLLVWLPWKILALPIDNVLQFQQTHAFSLMLMGDALVDVLFGGALLTVFAAREPIASLSGLSRGARLFPRLLLIEIKIAVLGLAVPLGVLYLSAGTVLTFTSSVALARITVLATILSLIWTAYIAFRYMLAGVTLVREQESLGWKHSPRNGWRRFTACGKSSHRTTGWALRAGRRLLRGQRPQAVLVFVVGQVVIGLAGMLIPEGQHIGLRVIAGITMVIEAFWWALVWEFLSLCLRDRGN